MQVQESWGTAQRKLAGSIKNALRCSLQSWVTELQSLTKGRTTLKVEPHSESHAQIQL